MSLRKIGTTESRLEVEDAPEDLRRTAGRRWTDEDERALAEENEENDEGS